MTASGAVVGVDIGGTKVLAAEVGDDGVVVRRALRHTPGRRVEPRLVEDALTQAVHEAAGERPLAAVGIAAAGLVDAAGERVRFAAHLPWVGEPVRTRLEERWGVPVALDNDATCAALAESELGAARGASSALMITLGTGIGGGVLVDGRVVRGFGGMAGEFGHMQLVPDGLACECGSVGCWEQYCSGNALVRHARAHLASSTALAELCDHDPAALTGPMVTVAAEDGDAVALDAFASVGGWLGTGLANLVAAFDPERLVVGGGVATAGELLLGPARTVLASSVLGAAHRELPTLEVAALGPDAGLVGAALMARLLT
ncbi:MAG: ROK family protein [Nocardioides sp.]